MHCCQPSEERPERAESLDNEPADLSQPGLAGEIQALFAAIGGWEMELPQRDLMPPPPEF